MTQFSKLLPPQMQPVQRQHGQDFVGSDALLSLSADPVNTCDCSGDTTYNQCSVTRNGCSPGYAPSCSSGPYNCGCECKTSAG